jgi:multicomponent Na+:H+ antiporter subunit G
MSGDLREVIAGVLGLTGAMFTLLAGIGVVRFPDALSRMHAATKATTLGLLLIVLGAEFHISAGSAKLALAVALVFLTTPVAAHLVGRSAYRAHNVDVRLDEVDQLAAAEEPGRGHDGHDHTTGAHPPPP